MMAKKAARNQALPGMEDRAIKPLHAAAEEYAEIRDARIELNQREGKLKQRVRELMHKHEKTHYKFENVEIDLEPPDGEEVVKVRIRKVKADRDADDAGGTE